MIDGLFQALNRLHSMHLAAKKCVELQATVVIDDENVTVSACGYTVRGGYGSNRKAKNTVTNCWSSSVDLDELAPIQKLFNDITSFLNWDPWLGAPFNNEKIRSRLVSDIDPARIDKIDVEQTCVELVYDSRSSYYKLVKITADILRGNDIQICNTRPVTMQDIQDAETAMKLILDLAKYRHS